MMDNDFVMMDECIGRSWMGRVRRAVADLVCRHTGHLLWRPGTVRDNPEGGYVRGDYAVSGAQ